MGNVHVEFWQFLLGMVTYTGAVAAIIWRLSKYLTIEEYKSAHAELDQRFQHRLAEFENRLRDLEIWAARKNGVHKHPGE